MNINGQRTKLQGDTVFIALPVEARRRIEGGCRCPYCVAHPDKTPMWDTVAVNAVKSDNAWTVHYPEFAR